MNKRNKYGKPSSSFRSYTDINNYNNFLLELDKTNKENPSHPPHPPSVINFSSQKESVKSFIKSVDKEFKSSDYKHQNFTGISPWEALLAAVEKNNDPNLYEKNVITPIDSDRLDKYAERDKVRERLNETPFVYKNKVNISTEIGNLSDLLKLIETYPDDKDTEYNINMKALHKIKTPLIELNNMIGMKELKENIVDQIIFYIQNLHTLNTSGNDFMHTVIYGPPGTGKTEIAKIIGSIFSKMGILKKGNFKKVTRADLIAGYLGQTALKTRDVVKECLGGVLFIDEAYALGNEEKRDSFSKECIDTLCEALSDHKENLMVIIAGYETDLNNCFFNYNQGLNSRFTWRFKTDEYSSEDLYNIFLKKVNDGGWHLAEETKIDVKWFEKNKSRFKFYGRDIETLFAKTKIAHSRRVFCLDPSVKKYLTLKDLDKGLEIYLKNEDSKSKDKDKEKYKSLINSMYV
jgi:ATP-dependent 26S proteasome regulatory subunit